jgi:2-isopropylmalate synthase
MRRITIFDTTLRDGEQSPGIALRPEAKAEIALVLERLGVDVVEAGYAASSPGDAAGVAAVAEAMTTATVASLCRATKDDVDAAAQALARAPRSRVHIFLATSALHMERKLGLSPQQVLERIEWSIRYAAQHVDEVEFSAEDASRTDRDFLVEAVEVAIESGARVINVPDTVGYAVPAEYGEMVAELLERVPELSEVELSVHCHNDLGMAVANTLAGVAAGATQVECTVNGIGERAGNAALEEVVMALRIRGDLVGAYTDADPSAIREASRVVAAHTGYPIARTKPIVGANAFAHEAGIHQDGLLKDVRTYQIIDPAELGLEMTLPLGKHSGRHAFVQACADAGLTLDADASEAAFRRFKRLADTGGAVTLDEVFHHDLEEVTA